VDALAAVALQGGPWGIIALVVVSLVRGWLIPRTTHKERIADYQAAIAEYRATIAELREQRDILLGKSREPIG
jgi:hypothetical protein